MRYFLKCKPILRILNLPHFRITALQHYIKLQRIYYLIHNCEIDQRKKCIVSTIYEYSLTQHIHCVCVCVCVRVQYQHLCKNCYRYTLSMRNSLNLVKTVDFDKEQHLKF